jgi:hypothetical protein
MAGLENSLILAHWISQWKMNAMKSNVPQTAKPATANVPWSGCCWMTGLVTQPKLPVSHGG